MLGEMIRVITCSRIIDVTTKNIITIPYIKSTFNSAWVSKSI